MLLAAATLYFVTTATDLALIERLAGDGTSGEPASVACVISAPLAQRVQAGSLESPPGRVAADTVADRGELRAALARVRSRVGIITGGVREAGVSYAAIDGLAEIAGAKLHQESADEPARLVCPSGIVEFLPLSDTAWVNRRPVKLPQVTRVINERLYVPVRGVGDVLPVTVRWDASARCWLLSCEGRTMRVASPEDLFEIEIDRSSRTLEVRYAGERLVLWPCCVGEGGNTPVGEFHIRNKAAWAPWRAYWGELIPGGSPRNPLGARWLGTTARGRETGRAIGIHGTNQPSSIGRRISGGCVRLTNAHAIEMYETIPIGTRVIIHE